MFEMYVPNGNARTDRVQAEAAIREGNGKRGGLVWRLGHSVGSGNAWQPPLQLNQLVQPPLGCAN